MTLMERILEKIEGIEEELEEGDRILIYTSEPCNCDTPLMGKYESNCVCGGKKVILDAKTFIGRSNG